MEKKYSILSFAKKGDTKKLHSRTFWMGENTFRANFPWKEVGLPSGDNQLLFAIPILQEATDEIAVFADGGVAG